MSVEWDNKGKILLADDDSAFRLATSAFLRSQGFQCEVAPDGTTAAELLRVGGFDLFIADIRMPGNAALELIEALPLFAAGLPVILLTGHPTLQTAARSVRLPVVAYLVKPCEPDELLEVARQSIANYRAYRAVAAHRQQLDAWSRDVAQFEQALRRAPGDAAAGPSENFLHLTLQNLLAALVDLKQFAETLGNREDRQRAAQHVALYNAVQETIQVLEKTRQSFKSKELGELRRRLETLVQTPPAGGGSVRN